VDPQVPRRRKFRVVAKRIRNRRNRRARRETLAAINNLINEITQSLSNLPPVFLPPSSPHISSSISEEKFPSPSRYDPISPILSPFSPIHDLLSSVTTARLLPDVSPPSPSYSSTSSMEFLGEKSQLSLLTSSLTTSKNYPSSSLSLISPNPVVLLLHERIQ